MKKLLITLPILAAALATIFFFQSTRQVQQTTVYTSTIQLNTQTTAETTTFTTAQTSAEAGEKVVISNPFSSSTDTGKTFHPPYVKVVIGINNTVTWVNEDTAAHTVTSVKMLFDATIQPMQTFSYVFTKPGIYEYTCRLHPWMSGAVEVVERR